VLRGGKQHCRVPIVTTAMKNTIVDGSMFESVGFLDGQCVDISAHADTMVSSAPLQHTDYARSPDTGMHVEAEFRQQSGNLVGSALFLKTKLRVLVNIMAPGLHIVVNMPELTHGM